MSAKKNQSDVKIPIQENVSPRFAVVSEDAIQRTLERFDPRPRTLAEAKAEIDRKLAAELTRKTEQYEAEQRKALGL